MPSLPAVASGMDADAKAMPVSYAEFRAEEFLAKLRDDGIDSYSVVFHDAIDRYMDNPRPDAGELQKIGNIIKASGFDVDELISQVESLKKTSWENSSDKYYAGATLAYDNVLQIIKELNADR